MPAFHPKRLLLFYGVCAIVAVVCLLCILGVRYIPKKISLGTQLATKDAVVFHIDEIERNLFKVYVRGWALKGGVSITHFDMKLLFRAADGTYYAVPCQRQPRTDVTTHVNDGNNYDNSGFETLALSPKFVAKGPFTLYILYRNNGENVLVDTGVVL